MTLKEAQATARDGEEFTAVGSNGVRWRCRWHNARRGLYHLIGRDGRPLRQEHLCDVRGAPDVRVEVAG